MNKSDVMILIKDWINKAPKNSDFGFVKDIESKDNVIQVFY